MKRVTKSDPCEACGHSGWCLHDEFSCLCMRNSAGRPHLLKSGETGYWHDLKEKPVKYVAPRKEPEVPEIDALKIYREMNLETRDDWLYELAEELGVTYESVSAVGAAWSKRWSAWAFPMKNGLGIIVGIRLRRKDGSKFAVTGSKQGIFIPYGTPRRVVYITEGPTDLCALLSMGLWGIARPSCSGGTAEINATIKRLHIQRAVIIADNDEDKELAGRTYNPGYDGAARLAETICCPNCVITLPCKDVREAVGLGLTAATLESLTQNCLWRNPSSLIDSRRPGTDS